jgi:hypothetical protein
MVNGEGSIMISIATILFLWLLVSIVAGIAIGKVIKFGSWE